MYRNLQSVPTNLAGFVGSSSCTRSFGLHWLDFVVDFLKETFILYSPHTMITSLKKVREIG